MKLSLTSLPVHSLIVLNLFLNACDARQNSKPSGHFEGSSEQQAEAFRGAQVVPPEYAPTQGVMLSSPLLTFYHREDLVKGILDAGAEFIWLGVPQGSTLNDAAYDDLRATLGSQISRVQIVEQNDEMNEETDDGSFTVWARDWSPLMAVTSNRMLRLLDFNYFEGRWLDDSFPRILEQTFGVKRASVPVYNEGGNFMINGRGACFMSDRVRYANSAEGSGTNEDDRILSDAEIKAYYKDFAGCSEVRIFPSLPTEDTGHIDVWAKFLNDETVLVNQIANETLSLAADESTRALAKSVQTFLEERANEIRAMGFTVVRAPMPLPKGKVFRTYANSLLVNGTALVPQYRDGNYADSQKLMSYETEVTRLYRDLGYRVVFIPSDALVKNRGAIHCVTMQIPRGQP